MAEPAGQFSVTLAFPGGLGQGRGRAVFSYACISRPLSSSSATDPFHKEKENVRSSTLHCSNAVQKLHCYEEFTTSLLILPPRFMKMVFFL
jgi:hypothetical protein